MSNIKKLVKNTTPFLVKTKPEIKKFIEKKAIIYTSKNRLVNVIDFPLANKRVAKNGAIKEVTTIARLGTTL